ncbi:DUF1764-domain-containing protein [Gymnopus androsaceus JB14]|uniref:DUF1764-domain-containing protein n=1 Tax=Gymnopus androsaceus JB14 TaxID=1447944 RepID=A0A6A4IKA5_9AGAR|nr:DUF1764-domain-containing protein [Gymnopus androsaceus JB14]
MPKSEIDDIFASKGKIAAQPSVGSAAASSSKSKKRKRKAETDENPSSQPSAKKVPETIIDPSASMPSAKRVKATKASEKAAEPKGKAKRESKNVKEQEDRFKDSRGSGPRRKTEEGWSIYKVDELGIGDDDQGGDTPLCPFDCDCCF